MWSSSSLCVSKKRRTEEEERSSQRKEGGPFESQWLSTLSRLFQTNRPPRGPRCSVPLITVWVIKVQHHPTTKRENKYCSCKLLALFDPCLYGLCQGWFPFRPVYLKVESTIYIYIYNTQSTWALTPDTMIATFHCVVPHPYNELECIILEKNARLWSEPIRVTYEKGTLQPGDPCSYMFYYETVSISHKKCLKLQRILWIYLKYVRIFHYLIYIFQNI